MARATSGDIEAQSDICQQYERQVRIVARVLLGNALRPHLDSMDLMQSVHKSLLMGLRDNRFDISTPEKTGRVSLYDRAPQSSAQVADPSSPGDAQQQRHDPRYARSHLAVDNNWRCHSNGKSCPGGVDPVAMRRAFGCGTHHGSKAIRRLYHWRSCALNSTFTQSLFASAGCVSKHDCKRRAWCRIGCD